MAVTAINIMNNGLAPVDRKWPVAPVASTAPQPSALEIGQDRFVAGQWWKNRAVPQGGQTTGCSCGNCPACVAGIYARQQRGTGDGLAASDATELAATGRDEPEPVPDDDREVGRQTGERGVETVKKPDGTPLTDRELRELSLLKSIDVQVKAHEMAHVAVAGPYARGGATFQYKRGPDGKNYAVGGEVQIDTSKEATPQATLAKMRVVRAAALAPADPSPQDRKVAAAASSAITEAAQQLRLIRMQQARGGGTEKKERNVAGEGGAGQAGVGSLAMAAQETAGNNGPAGRRHAGYGPAPLPVETAHFSIMI